MDNSTKLEVLKKLILIRFTEQTIAKYYPEQIMRCPVHLCLGEEATGAVFGVLAKREDLCFGNYRSHGHYLGKGGSLEKLCLELLGSFNGCSGGIGGSMHLIDLSCGFAGSSAIVGATIPQAAGAALAFKLRKEPYIVVVFFGDSAVEEGATYETINFSLLHQLPILFVCENNRLATNTPIELRTSSAQLYKRFASMGIGSISTSGILIDEMISTAEIAFEWIRSGKGPYFVECKVSRWAGHVGPSYTGPVDAWWRSPGKSAISDCPIANLVSSLIQEEILTVEEVKELYHQMSTTVEETFQNARQTSPGDNHRLQERVYSDSLQSSLPLRTPNPEPQSVDYENQHLRLSKMENPF